MSEYIHEIVLQEYIIDNILNLKFSVKFKNHEYNIIKARFNVDKTFWDLEGQLENGIWIPVEVEWISQNFITHKHHQSKDYNKFVRLNGVLLSLRRNREIEKIQQISILDTISEPQFKKDFIKWYKSKASEYVSRTLDSYFTDYTRNSPRILLYPLSKTAAINYFPSGVIYKKYDNAPTLLGFKESGFKANALIRDVQPNDISIFLFNNGAKMPRDQFKEKIKKNEIKLFKLAGFKIKSKLIDRREHTKYIDEFYWPDEIEKKCTIYPYVCVIEDEPFKYITDIIFPYCELFTDTTWEAFRSCMLHKEYREISPMEFSVFISSLK